MEDGIITSLKKYIEYLEIVRKNQMERNSQISDFRGITLSEIPNKNGRKYYKYRRKGMTKFRYLGGENSPKVEAVKEARYYDVSLDRIESNLVICRNTLQRLERTDFDSITEALPKTYKGAKIRMAESVSHNMIAERWKEEKEAYKLSKGPWYPEYLKDTTADGSKVRSKSEALIYNEYYYQKCTFVYELPVTILGRYERHPDFCILTESDWRSTILHDHQGRYGFDEDRERYNRDMYLYWQDGYIPGVNILYTFDDPNGGFDLSVVQNIIDTKIRPK